MPLQYSGIDDAVIAAQRNLGRGKFTDAASDIQKYVAFKHLMRSAHVQTTEEYGQSWQVLTEDNDSAAWVGLYNSDDTNVNDGLQKATVDMRHLTGNWSYDQREIDLNVRNAAARIVSLVKVRRAQCYISQAKKLEAAFWTLPSASDTVTMYGVPYYIVRSADAAGFNGGNPSGYSDCAGIDSDVYTTWKNYTARYVSLTYTDIVQKLEAACIKTMWEPPVDINDYNTGNSVGLYTNYDVVEGLIALVRAQNDNLGRDLAYSSGKVLFRSTPVTYVPYLDSVSTDPVYGINWGDFKILIDKKWFLREDPPEKVAGKHTVRSVFVDSTVQLKNTNRRTQFIVDKA